MSDPKRLLDDDIDATLRGALDAGRREAPSDQRLEAILARLPTEPGGGGGGGGGGVGAAKPMGALTKAALGFGAFALVGGAALLLVPPREAAVGPVAMPTTSASTAAAPAPVEVVSAVPSASVAVPAPTHAASVGHPAVALPPPDPALEVSLLQDAHDALARAPDVALAKCAEQERLFPKSTVAQEREVIAIDALLRLHRDPEARVRAAAFSARFPGSASQRRVDALLGQ